MEDVRLPPTLEVRILCRICSRYAHLNPSFPLDFVTGLLNSDLLDARTVCSYLEKELYIGTQDDPNRKSSFYESLGLLRHISTLYERLQGALISLSILSIPLHTAKWMSKYLDPLSLSESFACIAMFATGYHNLGPRIFSDILGFSYGNTLYISELLLNDPWKCFGSNELPRRICCLIGNIGKPGLSLLLSVREPMHQEADLPLWNLIKHDEFDGKLEDNFRSTAVQLSLTGYS